MGEGKVREVKGRRRGSHPHDPAYEAGAFLGSSHAGRVARERIELS